MELSPMPDENNGQGESQVPAGRDHFTNFVTANKYVPMWVHPHVASGILRHFGRDGTVLVHPHPNSGHPAYATGGVTPDVRMGAGAEAGPRAAMPIDPRIQPVPIQGNPPAAGGGQGLAGIPQRGPARSIFAGGPVGAGGPANMTPVFAQEGDVMDGTNGTGKVPGVDMGHDSVHAMLEPGEAVFNKEQLKGIQPRKGKEHLLRGDQKAAMRKASGRASRK